MHLCMCCQGWLVYKIVCISCIAISRAALLSLVGKANSPPICLHSPMVQLAIALGSFLYNFRSPTPWIFTLNGFSSMSNMYTLSVDALLRSCCLGFPRSALEGCPFDCFLFDVFGGSSKAVWGTWVFFPCELILRIHIFFLGSLPLLSGLILPFFSYCLAEFLCDHLSHVVPFW